MSSQSYKVRFNDQFRRFSLPFESTYFQLRKKIEEVFPEVPSKGFQLYYLDEEGDQISVNSQTELDEAKRLSKLIIRLIVHIREQPANTQNTTQPTQSQPQNSTRGDEAKPSFTNPLGQNSSFVQMVRFVEPYLSNPTLLKAFLPILLSEMNKNNYIPKEEIEKLNQMGNQLLDYPSVQDFISVKLPKILQQVTGSTSPPAPTTTTSTPTPTPSATNTTTASASEQIQDLVMPFVSMAQSFAQNLSQNINSQITPVNRQEGSQPTSSSSLSSSTTSPAVSNPEPKKPALKETASVPVYQPPPNYVYKPADSYKVETPAEKTVVPLIPTPETRTPVPVPAYVPVLVPGPMGGAPPKSRAVPFEKELAQLKELGFTDTQLLNDLLVEHRGDLNRVIDILSEEY